LNYPKVIIVNLIIINRIIANGIKVSYSLTFTQYIMPDFSRRLWNWYSGRLRKAPILRKVPTSSL